jgi:nicotinamide mononucleotide transporter
MTVTPIQLLEALAVVLALAYLLLAARENILCWYCAFVSSALYTVIFWDVSLLMEVALNLFYVVMAVVGWQQWRRGGQEHAGVRIVSLLWWQHLVLLALMLTLALGNGWVMHTYTEAAWPFVDAFIAWGCVINTVLVVRKVLENWLYWLLLDGLALVVYLERGLYLTALLFALYLVIVVFGYLRWRREYLAVGAATAGRAA